MWGSHEFGVGGSHEFRPWSPDLIDEREICCSGGGSMVVAAVIGQSLSRSDGFFNPMVSSIG